MITIRVSRSTARNASCLSNSWASYYLILSTFAVIHSSAKEIVLFPVLGWLEMFLHMNIIFLYSISFFVLIDTHK